jgi:beta-lactamase regulating signal transducer with metallopeptidase domain
LLIPYTPKVTVLRSFYNFIEDNNQFTSGFKNVLIDHNVASYIGVAWLIIAVVLIIKKIISYQAYTRFIKANRKEINNDSITQIFNEVCREMRVENKIGLYSYKMIHCPMLIGFTKPYIVLPEIMLNKTQNDLRYILIHEITHHKRKDFLYKWLIQIISCVYFFNPVTHMIKKKIIDYCEFSCDESVIKRLDNHGKAAYGSALIESLEINAGLKQYTAVSLMLCEDAVQIKERLAAIKRHQKSSRLITASTVILTGVICLSSFFIGVFNNIFSNGVCYCLGALINLCSLCR